MKPNEEFNRRAGVGCPDNGSATQPEEFEVLPPLARGQRYEIGPVCFDRRSIIQSPCFWMLVGVGLGIGAAYYFGRDRR